MQSRSGKYSVLGILAIVYGVILCCFWMLALSGNGWEILRGPWTIGGVLRALVFASVPVLLIYAGWALRSNRAGIRVRIWAAAITAVALGAKAILASSWAFDEGGLASWLLMTFVVVPSGVWALVLAGTAAWLTPDASARLEGAAGTDEDPTSAKRLQPSRGTRVCGVVALGLAVLAAGIAIMWNASQPSPITATELLAAYQGDVAKADRKYRGEWLEVMGKVARLRKVSTMAPWSGTVWVYIESDDKAVPGTVTISVSDAFPFDLRAPGATYQDFGQLTEGQEVTILGRCGGLTDLGVTLERPRIVR